MAVYVDHAFLHGEWGIWSGGGHLQADTTEELHAFAARLGLRGRWFQHRPGRPDRDHYDLTAEKRRQALAEGAITEDRRQGVARRRRVRRATEAAALAARFHSPCAKSL
jgi:Ser/Thr protein kinase RdoA (MazF antagonist)